MTAALRAETMDSLFDDNLGLVDDGLELEEDENYHINTEMGGVNGKRGAVWRICVLNFF